MWALDEMILCVFRKKDRETCFLVSAHGKNQVGLEFVAARLRILDLLFPSSFIFAEIKLKSLILAQIERWRHALHMQVER